MDSRLIFSLDFKLVSIVSPYRQFSEVGIVYAHYCEHCKLSLAVKNVTLSLVFLRGLMTAINI